MISNGDFPKQIRLSHKVAVWRESEIDEWISHFGGNIAAPKVPRVEGEVAYIPLSQGYEAIVDSADLPLVGGYEWTAHVTKRGNGSVRSVYAYRACSEGSPLKTVRLHRVLMNAPEGVEVDHVNGDGLDCRRKNMRLTTITQNQQNKRIGLSNTSGIKGVSWHRATGKWCAQIMADGKKHSLGYFDDKNEAASAYAAASVRLHGDFGRTA